MVGHQVLVLGIGVRVPTPQHCAGSHIVVASSATRRKGGDTRFSPRRSKLVLGIGVRVPTPQQAYSKSGD